MVSKGATAGIVIAFIVVTGVTFVVLWRLNILPKTYQCVNAVCTPTVDGPYSDSTCGGFCSEAPPITCKSGQTPVECFGQWQCAKSDCAFNCSTLQCCDSDEVVGTCSDGDVCVNCPGAYNCDTEECCDSGETVMQCTNDSVCYNENWNICFCDRNGNTVCCDYGQVTTQCGNDTICIDPCEAGIDYDCDAGGCPGNFSCGGHTDDEPLPSVSHESCTKSGECCLQTVEETPRCFAYDDTYYFTFRDDDDAPATPENCDLLGQRLDSHSTALNPPYDDEMQGLMQLCPSSSASFSDPEGITTAKCESDDSRFYFTNYSSRTLKFGCTELDDESQHRWVTVGPNESSEICTSAYSQAHCYFSRSEDGGDTWMEGKFFSYKDGSDPLNHFRLDDRQRMVVWDTQCIDEYQPYLKRSTNCGDQ